VLQAHGPADKALERSPILWWVTGLLVLSASTRIFAFLRPDLYLGHLAYSSVILSLSVLVWSVKYLPYAWYFPGEGKK
jgi:uncharacterized protein involved in response to NO